MNKIEIMIEATGRTPDVPIEVISGIRQPTNEEYEVLKEVLGIDFRSMEQPEYFLRSGDSLDRLLDRIGDLEEQLREYVERPEGI